MRPRALFKDNLPITPHRSTSHGSPKRTPSKTPRDFYMKRNVSPSLVSVLGTPSSKTRREDFLRKTPHSHRQIEIPNDVRPKSPIKSPRKQQVTPLPDLSTDDTKTPRSSIVKKKSKSSSKSDSRGHQRHENEQTPRESRSRFSPLRCDGDRFIPNRSQMRVDICRANVLSAEEVRMEAIEKHRRGERPVTRANRQNHANHAAYSEVMTPVLVEYRSRLRGALLNISVHNSNTGPRNLASASNISRQMADADVSYGLRSVTPSLPSTSDYSSLVYDEIFIENTSGVENIDPCQRMLAFKSSAKDPLNSTFSSYGSSSVCNISAETPDPYAHDQLRVFDRVGGSSIFVDPALDSAVHSTSSKPTRKINSAPTRILDAPELVDDYYLNLISWGKDDILAVALGQCVYLWNARNGEIQHLLTLSGDEDFVTSVRWADLPGHTNCLAVGTNEGPVQLWDVVANKKLRSMRGHVARVGSLAWTRNILSSGGRDSVILQHDVRSSNHIVSTYAGHTQEVCGLEWNEDGTTLASGGNENYLCIWDAAMSMRRNQSGRALNSSSRESPRLLLTQHQAAVKALAWCPFHRGLLASGGGTADRTIKFWNSNSGAVLNSVDTGSQVCSLLWSQHQRELCSSHGFSENQLILWRYPTMSKIQEFKGHTARVLHMEQSPDGASVVSAAADETLRFWDVFGSPPSKSQRNTISMGSLGSFTGHSSILR